MNIVAYGDESGTQGLDHGQQPGSPCAVLAGYFGFAEDWLVFQVEWQSVLSKYRVPYFHFGEYADKPLCAKEGSSYFGWTPSQRDDFLHALASKAPGDRLRFPFAAALNSAPPSADPQTQLVLRSLGLTDKQTSARYMLYASLFHQFFDAFMNELKVQRPEFDGQISFVFDRKEGDRVWQLAAGQTHHWFAQDDPRFKGITFADKRIELPLQAADLIAHRTRQVWQNMLRDERHPPWSKLDYILWGNFKDYEEFRQHYSRFLGRDLTPWDGL